MKTNRTAADNADWWLRQAERYDRQAQSARTDKDKAHWQDMASGARANAIASAS
jgi:hypothetical protein